RYRNELAVIGYDLLNEPIAPYFDTASLNPKLEPLYRRIVSAIREVDRNHIIFLGGAQWDTNFKIFGSPFDPKVAYTFHKYWMTIVAFADGPRTSFEEVRKHRPPKEKVQKALNDYLERIKFANCRVNQGYLKALALK